MRLRDWGLKLSTQDPDGAGRQPDLGLARGVAVVRRILYIYEPPECIPHFLQEHRSHPASRTGCAGTPPVHTEISGGTGLRQFERSRHHQRLKGPGFLDESGVPQARYHAYLDQTQSALVLAEAIREAYEDLFRVNRNAHAMSATEVKNKMKTLSEGAFTDRVLTQMAGTFTTLVKAADFKSDPSAQADTDPGTEGPRLQDPPSTSDTGAITPRNSGASPFASLAYNINIQLPESRDPAVYNAIFKALREHFR